MEIISKSKRKGNMNEPILVRGQLSRKVLDAVRAEILDAVNQGKFPVLILASDGGNLQHTIDFIDWLDALRADKGVEIGAKIYNAGSACALIALTADKRTIVPTGELILHTGTISLEVSEIGNGGQVSTAVANEATRAKNRTFGLIKRFSKLAGSSTAMATLSASGSLTLNAKQCLELEICGKTLD